jgi:hypothetical protein
MDGNSADAERVAGTQDPESDFAAICYDDLVEHRHGVS